MGVVGGIKCERTFSQAREDFPCGGWVGREGCYVWLSALQIADYPIHVSHACNLTGSVKKPRAPLGADQQHL